MTNTERAKQFMPFAALKGFEEALKEAEFVPEEKILLGEDAQEELDQILRELAIGDNVTATYYTSQQYVTLTGPVVGLMNLRNPSRFLAHISRSLIYITSYEQHPARQNEPCLGVV